MEFIIKKYGLSAIVAGVIISVLAWLLAHSNAEPGTKVSMLWGFTEYTKKKIPIQNNSPVTKYFSPKSIDRNSNSKSDNEKKTEKELLKIFNKLDKTPPFQRKHIANSYVGLKVNWEAKLHSVTTLSPPNVRITLATDPSSAAVRTSVIVFESSADSYPKIKTLEPNQVVAITGTISFVTENGTGVDLKNVKIH